MAYRKYRSLGELLNSNLFVKLQCDLASLDYEEGSCNLAWLIVGTTTIPKISLIMGTFEAWKWKKWESLKFTVLACSKEL